MKDSKGKSELSDSTIDISETQNQVDHGERGGKKNISDDQNEIMQDPEQVQENLDLSGKD